MTMSDSCVVTVTRHHTNACSPEQQLPCPIFQVNNDANKICMDAENELSSAHRAVVEWLTGSSHVTRLVVSAKAIQRDLVLPMVVIIHTL